MYQNQLRPARFTAVCLMLCFVSALSGQIAGIRGYYFGFNKKSGYTKQEGGVVKMLPQSDGKMILGCFQPDANKILRFSLIRCLKNGAMDETYGKGGKFMPVIGNVEDQCLDIAITPDDQIFGLGQYYNIFRDEYFLIKVRKDGSPDPLFGKNGIVLLPTDRKYWFFHCLAVSHEGKIFIGCYFENHVALLRFNADGSMDNTFGTKEKIVTKIAAANCITIQADGKILLAGSIENDTHDKDIQVVRFLKNGTLDNSFGNGGSSVIGASKAGEKDDVTNALAVQPDGKIIVVGNASDSVGNDVLAVRMLANGKPDESFGTHGVATFNVGLETDKTSPDPDNRTRTDEEANAVSITKEGKIYIAGWVGHPDQGGDILLMRVNANGTLDYDFGSDGIVAPDMQTKYYGKAMIMEEDGIVIAGMRYGELLLKRYE